jgi:hypothetical protein
MRRCPVFLRWLCVLFTIQLVWLQGERVATQQSLPWTGIATDEARSVDTGAFGAASVRSHALSGDGRYIAFTANYPLISSDTNNLADIYVRDRMTGDVELISVASDGSPADGSSDPAAISEDGRHVAFMSSASNLVPGDNNGQQDVFVYDRVTHTTSLVSLGVNGEAAQMGLYDGISLSADGRFVTFGAIFDNPSGWWDMFLRDRDPDTNGVFDEPGLATTTRIAPDDVGEWHVYFANEAVISPDGRYVGFTAAADLGGSLSGNRVFLLDRQTSETVRIDVSLGDEGVFNADAHAVSLSNGHLAYVTNVDNLVEDDTAGGEDVFVYDIASGTNSIVRASVPDLPAMPYKSSTGISADGRYVIFTGSHPLEPYGMATFGFAVDRETRQTHEIGLRPDGVRTQTVYSVALSADGSAIAMWNSSDVLANLDANFGVYVETAIAISPATVDLPEEGGTQSIELTAPSNTRWIVEHDPTVSVSPDSGTGPATIEVTIDANATGRTRVLTVAVGSESTTFRQLVPLVVDAVSPDSGAMTGGDQVLIVGSGFTQQSTVTFGGTPSPSVWVIDGQQILALTPPNARGYADVVVSDPVSPSGTLENGFRFLDVTPPVITPIVTGTLGLNNWYISDVTVAFTVEDPESEIEWQYCDDVGVINEDTALVLGCSAQSEGGFNGDSVEIQRDATPPSVSIVVPQPRTYQLNEIAALNYDCGDNMSGLESCVPSAGGTLLDTSAVGTFTFSVTATDVAGHTSTNSVSYTVKAPSTLSLTPASGTYGGTTSLTAMLTGAGAPLAGRTVAFTVNSATVGTAVTDASGVATLAFNLTLNGAGAHSRGAQFAGDQTTMASGATSTLTILKAPTSVSWNTPSPITYGTPLSGAQLNATASVFGWFTYTPAAGTVLGAGTQTLSVTFTPNDTANYLGSSGSVVLVVNKATPSITWPPPSSITYGTALSSAQLNATANVAGTFVYSPGVGVVLPSGTHALSAAFTPSDSANYNDVTAGQSVTVTTAALTIQAGSTAKVYGQALPSFTISAAGFVNGDTLASLSGALSFSTAATAASAPGTYSVTPGGLSSQNYSITFAAGTLTVTKAGSATVLIANPNPSRPNRDVTLQASVSAVAPGAGVASGVVEFRENGTLLGTATLVNGVATVTMSFKKGSHPLTATFLGDTNFNGSSGSTTLATN